MYRTSLVRCALVGLGATVALGPFSNQPAAGQNSDLDAFNNAALSEHNTHRATHHTPALNLTNSLNATAQAHAETMLATGTFAHSSAGERNDAGENLFYSLAQQAPDPALLAEQAVRAWYGEVEDYNYANPGFRANTGHFTQVVWKESTQLGCGVAQGPTTYAGRQAIASYVVCHYAPAGNVQGRFPDNVIQP